MDMQIHKIELHNDKRGELMVFLTNSSFVKKDRKFGQIYLITFAKKGVIRGNHYHKKWREWFTVVHGRLELFLKDIKTGETQKMILNNKNQHIGIEIGPYIAHTFRSLSTSATLLNYASHKWSKYDCIPAKIF